MKLNSNKAWLVALSALAVQPLSVSAQSQPSCGVSQIYSPLADGYLCRAREMSKAGNFAGVIDQLRHLRSEGTVLSGDAAREADFLFAKAMYETGNPECLPLLDGFADTYPASEDALRAALMAADYFYFRHEFGPAALRYGRIGIDGLDPSARALYRFRHALSLLKSGMIPESARIFSILQADKKYAARAGFYLAYIDYLNGDLDKAYQGFSRVEGDLPGNSEVSRAISRGAMPRREPYVPTGYEAAYYMTQIDFTRGKYDAVIERAYYLLSRRLVPQFRSETERILGESYYKTGNHDAALTYLDDYLTHCREEGVKPESTAAYALGNILYDRGRFDRAASIFQTLSSEKSEIGQGASLFLGQIAAERKDYSQAALHFEKAWRMSYDPHISEAALYNYAAASTKGAALPFTSSVTLLEEFLSSYPRSAFAPAVEEYLATAYFYEKDYDKAMQSIERIPNPSRKVLMAKQKVAYQIGVEAMAANNPERAARYMRMAHSMKNCDPAIALQSQLWLGDALYALARYQEAERAYRDFISSSPRDANRSLALYNLAYTLYMQADYRTAARYFSDALSASPRIPAPLRADAMIRRADCFYYSGDTGQAISSYSQALDAGASDSDYALLRRALMHGVGGDLKAKLADLERLEKDFPSSRWAASALLEKGLALNDLGRFDAAAEALRSVSSRYPESPEARKALLDLAIILTDKGRTDEGIRTYRSLISRWPSSEEALMAHEDLRKIYAASGDLKDYSDWLARIPGAPRIKADEMESLAFDAAQRALSADPSDTSRLEKYVRDYPSGSNLAQALLDLAETAYEAGHTNQAFNYADRLLLARPGSPQQPRAILIKALVLEKHRKETQSALQTYRLLESTGGADFASDAYAGIMRTTSDPRERYDYARKLARSGGVSADAALEASLYEALALKDMHQEKRAVEILSSLAADPASLAGAQAAVELAQIYIDARRWKDAEAVLTEFTDAGTPHKYWLARGFIALADACHGQGKDYLAVEYLESLRKNYPGSEKDIRNMISQRLAKWKSK